MTSCPSLVPHPDRYIIHRKLGLTQRISYFHQRETEQVQSLPFAWCLSVGTVGGESDAPNLVNWARLHDDAVTCVHEELAKCFVLRELCKVCLDHDVESSGNPTLFVEITHQTSELLGLRRIR